MARKRVGGDVVTKNFEDPAKMYFQKCAFHRRRQSRKLPLRKGRLSRVFKFDKKQKYVYCRGWQPTKLHPQRGKLSEIPTPFRNALPPRAATMKIDPSERGSYHDSQIPQKFKYVYCRGRQPRKLHPQKGKAMEQFNSLQKRASTAGGNHEN